MSKEFKSRDLPGHRLTIQVAPDDCTGCGVCILACSTDALKLVRRSDEEILVPPQTEEEWRHLRAEARGIDLKKKKKKT